MRIFFASHRNPTTLRDSNLWHDNLLGALRDLGHDVVLFDYDLDEVVRNVDFADERQRRVIDATRPRTSEALVDQVSRAHRERPIDLLFSYFYSATVEPGAIADVNGLGIATMNWYCNASFQFHLVEEIAPAFDYCLVPERFRLDDYRRVGANPVYCQEAANPSVYRPFDEPVVLDCAFGGQCYGDRPSFVAALLAAGIDARVWGPSWEHAWDVSVSRRIGSRVKRALTGRPGSLLPRERCGPPLSDDEYVRLFSRSRISLGFSKVGGLGPNGEVIRQVRLRDFEAPMSGAFYLAEECDELGEFFEPGTEIAFFGGQEELVEKARYYLRHGTERERIRLAGMRRARAEHTWQARLGEVFVRVGLTPG